MGSCMCSKAAAGGVIALRPAVRRQQSAARPEALGQGIYFADVIFNILARRRDPGPPLTILTPDAVKLRTARSPIAPDTIN